MKASELKVPAKYSAARRALIEATKFDEVRKIRNTALAAQTYARAAKDREMIVLATDLRLESERRAGEMLAISGKSGERARSGRPEKWSQAATIKLSDIGVSKTQSSRWQKLAAMRADAFEDLKERIGKKAVNAVDGAAKRTRQEMHAADAERVLTLVTRPGKYRALVIDPPWDYEWLSVAGRAKPGYATMTQEQLLAVDMQQWTEDSCHIYLWTTNNFITRACDLMKAWGFEHKTVLTWVKPKLGLGSYFRNTTEHVLFGMRGELRTRSDSIPTHFMAPLGEHSEKPEEFYEIVRASSFGPFGEVFQREPRPDFTNCYGSAEMLEAAE